MIIKNYFEVTRVILIIIFFVEVGVANCKEDGLLKIIKEENKKIASRARELKEASEWLQLLEENSSKDGLTRKEVLKKVADILTKINYEKNPLLVQVITDTRKANRLSKERITELAKKFRTLVNEELEKQKTDWLRPLIDEYLNRSDLLAVLENQEISHRIDELHTTLCKKMFKMFENVALQPSTSQYFDYFNIKRPRVSTYENPHDVGLDSILRGLINNFRARKSDKTKMDRDGVMEIQHPERNEKIRREKVTLELSEGRILTIYVSMLKSALYRNSVAFWVFIYNEEKKKLVPVEIYEVARRPTKALPTYILDL